MIKKQEKAVLLLKQGRFEKAISIIAKFRLGFSREEKRIIEIAHECLSGHSSLYEAIGIDAEKYISKAKGIIERKCNVQL